MIRFHHVQMNPKPEKFDELKKFYTEVLQFRVLRQWHGSFNGNSMECAMLESSNGMQLEVFGNGASIENLIGTIRHISLSCDDIENLVRKCNELGYPSVTPKGELTDKVVDYMVLCEQPYYAMELAFIKGPCGEIVEFQKEFFEPEEERGCNEMIFP